MICLCGIFGVIGVERAVVEAYQGLVAQQHRGQDACGIHTFDGAVHVKKGVGQVSEVFRKRHFAALAGDAAIGHVRYATVGSGSSGDIQPLYESAYFLVSLAHNGNLTNFSGLKDSFKTFATECDLEAILKVFHSGVVNSWIVGQAVRHLGRKVSGVADQEGIDGLMRLFDSQDAASRTVLDLDIPSHIDMSSGVAIDCTVTAVRSVMERCEGSFSAICLVPGLGLLGFKDPYGIKPLVFGTKSTPKGTAYAFASEDVAFQDPLGYDFVGEVQPGTLVIAREGDSPLVIEVMPPKGYRPCIFEKVYFASPCSRMDGISISEYRFQLGKAAGMIYAESRPDILADSGKVVCGPVPSAPMRGAEGFASATGINCRQVLVRNNYTKRGFILPDRAAREQNAKLKLPIDFSVLEGVETLILIDDSIVRGDTSRNLVARIRHEAKRLGLGLKQVHFVSLAPQNLYPCVYGIDMAVDTELIAVRSGSVDAVGRFIGVDYIQYPPLEVLGAVLRKVSGGRLTTYCDACFSGNYPTGITLARIEQLKKERLADKGSDYGEHVMPFHR